MKKFIILTTTILLSACKPNDSSPPPTKASTPQVLTASAASEVAMAASSPIVSQILNSPQEQDILASSRQAMAEVSASEVAVASAVMASAAQTVETTEVAPEDTVKLPPVCEAYYQRVDKCFAKDSEFAAELREMNQEARLDLAHDNPTDKACTSLNQSFNAVARNLGCE